MNFEFSDDQRMVQDQARQVFRDTCPLTAVRSVLEGDALYAESTWKQLGSLGYLGVAIPEQYGGSGLGALELCLIAEEAGRALAPIPFSTSIAQAAVAIELAGSEEQKKRLLPDLASGERIGVVALTDLRAVRSVEDGVRFENGQVSGVKASVCDAAIADLLIVRVATSQGPSLALVELDQPTVTREEVESIDATRPHRCVRFDGAQAELLGEEGTGEAIVEQVRQRAAILLGFEQIGAADAALEMARDYALTRKTFGRLIGSYQAIKHKLADVYVKNQIARGHCYYGAWAFSTNATELPLAAAGVHVAATNAFTFAAQENIQTHGGIGFTWEADCHFFYRRARLYALAFGPLRSWKERLLTAIEADRAA